MGQLVGELPLNRVDARHIQFAADRAYSVVARQARPARACLASMRFHPGGVQASKAKQKRCAAFVAGLDRHKRQAPG